MRAIRKYVPGKAVTGRAAVNGAVGGRALIDRAVGCAAGNPLREGGRGIEYLE